MPSFDLDSFLPYRLSVLSRLTQDFLAAALGESGVTIAQWRVFLCLTRVGPSHLNGLAAMTRLPQSSLSRSIAQMAERGLVRNVRNPDDRRVARIEMTAAGRREFARLTRRIDAACQDAFRMNPAEEASFRSMVDALIVRLSGEPLPTPAGSSRHDPS